MAKRILLLCLVLAALLWWAPCRAQASEVEGIYEKSGAGELYDALDQDTQDLLSQAGIGEGKAGRPPERAGGAAGGGGPLPAGGHLRGGRQRLPFGGDAGLRRCPHRPPGGADTGRPAGDRKRLRVPGGQCAGVLGAAAGLGEYGGGGLLQLLDFGRRQSDSRPVLGAAHAPAAHVPAAGLGLQLVRRRL